jgi:receptor protein-tyrosine kinase
LGSQFQLLRARIESELHAPVVILVTSAATGDGKSVTAFGLAESLSSVGHRVALVDANVTAPAAQTLTSPTVLSTRLPIFGLPVDKKDPVAARETARGFLRDLRGRFDFTIVDGAPFMQNSISMLLAGAVDGVLLTVKLGRAQLEGDELLARALDHAGANVVGIVTVAGDCIAEFRRTRANPRTGEVNHLREAGEERFAAATFAS